MTDQERNILNNGCSIIVQRIQQLIDNKVAENLSDLNNDVHKKIDSMTQTASSLMAQLSQSSSNERSRLDNNIQDIRKNIEEIRQSQNSIMEKRLNFAKVCSPLNC